MISAVEWRLRSFAGEFLERQGGVIEWLEQQDAGYAVLPRPLAEILECPPDTPITTKPAAEGLSINLGSQFWERVRRCFPAVSGLTLKIDALYLKKSSMDEPVARAFGFSNARARVSGALPERVEYQYWYFTAGIESDERWDDVFRVVINSRTGAVLDLPDPLTMAEVRVAELAAVPPTIPIIPIAIGTAARKAQDRAETFVRRLEERMRRDAQRLREYYAALLAEDTGRARGSPVEPAVAQSRRKAVELELKRKTDELRERYTLRLALRPVALVRLEIPALAVKIEARHRGVQTDLTVYWNALAKTLEPLACARCSNATFAIHLAEDLSVRCPACRAS